MNNNLEKNIRYKIFIIYIVIAFVFAGIVYYIYNFRGEVHQQKINVDRYNREFILTNNLISNVQQAQSAANLYRFSGNNLHLRKFQTLQAKIKQQIDSLSHYGSINNNNTLYQIDSLLNVKGEITQRLTKELAQHNPLEPLYDKLQTYDTISVVENSVIVSSVQQDTVINLPQRKNVWRRIGEVFSPEKSPDTTLFVTRVQVDTLVSFSVDTSGIVSDIKQISQEVDRSYSNRIKSIEKQINTLVASDQEISNQLSTLLIEIHGEALNSMFTEIQQSEQGLNKNYKLSIIAAIIILMLMLIFITLIINDVNKGYTARKGLEEANKRTEEIMQSRHKLLLSVSHDIKTPLSSIMGYLDLWREENLPADKVKRIDSMQRSAKHILSLLTNLLEFSRLEQHSVQITKKDIDFLDLLDEMVSMFEPLAGQKGLDFNYEFNITENRYIRTDYLKFKQILTNILSNAIKYTSVGKIDFKVSEQHNYLIIEITDTGTGIAKNKIATIFKPFFRIENNTNEDGSGLGMYVVKGLVNLLRGIINVESEQGIGTTVKLKIPVTKILAENMVNTLPNKILSQYRHYNVLVIDDDDSLLTMLNKMLEKLGHKVNLCKKSQCFELELKNINNYDIIITDMEMGAITGKDVLRKIKVKNQGIPVVIMTAKGDFTDERAKKMGFNAYLEKPFSLQSLSELLSKLTVEKQISAETYKSEFSLLYEMLDGDIQSMRQVLETFVNSTADNLKQLEISVSENDFSKTQMLCHKMLPMFLQLGQHDTAEILKTMDGMKGAKASSYPQWKSEMLVFIEKAKLLLDKLSKFTES